MKYIKGKKIIFMLVIILLLISLVVPVHLGQIYQKVIPFATLEFEPKFHDFGDMYEGEIGNTTFEIWRGGSCCELTYTLSWDCDWIDVFPTSGVSYGEHDPIEVTIDTEGLDIGQHYCDILIESNSGNGVFNVSVNIIYATEPKLAFYPQSHNFGYQEVGYLGTTSFDVWNTGTGLLTYSITWDDSWVDITPTSGDSTGEHDEINVEIDTTGLSEGQHISEVTISSNGGEKTYYILVTIGTFPKLELTKVKGGLLKVEATVFNNGTKDAIGVPWRIMLNDGIIFTGKTTEGKLPVVPAGEERIITSKFIIGFGETRVYVGCECEDFTSDEVEVPGQLLIIFVKI